MPAVHSAVFSGDVYISYFNLNMSQADVENALSGIPSFDSGAFQNRIPIIVDIKGSGEYAVLNFSNIGGSMWGYRKREEFSGQ